MSEKVARIVRKQAQEVQKALTPEMEILTHNEAVTRGRVDELEAWALRFSRMGPWEKVRWLLSRGQ